MISSSVTVVAREEVLTRMHAWMWGERWPSLMDALVPLASLPAPIVARNRVWRKMAMDDLRDGHLAGAVLMLLIGGSAPTISLRARARRSRCPIRTVGGGAKDRWSIEILRRLRCALAYPTSLRAMISRLI
ncbi:MAG: hypothetical protein ACXW2Q_00990 [Thermoanaerobaculia bacterium]